VTILELQGVTKHFPTRDDDGIRRVVQAVSDVSLDVDVGETLGIVGESGCGKSTVAKLATRLLEPTAGSVLIDGQDVSRLGRRGLRPFRRTVQLVFQDPFGSLNPRLTVGQLIAEPMRVHRLATGRKLRSRVDELIEMVGLSPDHADRHPHQFSGGQRQRIGIARALAVSPRLLILDEPVSALDVSVQAQIVNLLMDLQSELGLAYVFIAHDLSIVRHVSNRVAVMYLGRIVESGATDEVFLDPQHPYTQALLSAIPSKHLPPERRRARIVLPGEVPDPADPPSGCAFHLRCWRTVDRCLEERPALAPTAVPTHRAACFRPGPTDSPSPFVSRSQSTPSTRSDPGPRDQSRKEKTHS